VLDLHSSVAEVEVCHVCGWSSYYAGFSQSLLAWRHHVERVTRRHEVTCKNGDQ